MARTVTCATEDCDRPTHCKGVCRRCYDRGREVHRHRVREDRVLALRARNRAVSRLIATHREAFEAILADCRVEVLVEDAELRALAEAEGVDLTGDRQVYRLRPGPYRDGETAADRLAEAVAECDVCKVGHVNGHACPACGAAPVEQSEAS